MCLRMSDPRIEQREWLLKVLDKTGLSGTALALKARLAQTTITRFLNDDEHGHALSARSIAAIEDAAGMRFGPDPRPVGLRESEATPYDARKAPAELNFIQPIIGQANGIDPWMLRSRALETAGYLPGDVLIVDLNREPSPGDVVCAQLYDWARSKAETVFRLYEPPYLTVATFDNSLRKIFVVDNQTTVIKGVVIASIRPRTARAAAA